MLAPRFIGLFACAGCLLLATPAAQALAPAPLWNQRFGSTSADIGYSAAVDASGNVFVTGNFQGTVNFGGGDLVSAGGTDIFVAKYDAAGVHQWSQRFGSTGSESGSSVAVAAFGAVVVTGQFEGTVDFGGIFNMVSAGGTDIFVAKYDAAGVRQWSLRFGSTSNDFGNSVAVDALGSVRVTGSFSGTVNFNGGNLVSAGGSDIFVAKYNTGGSHQWSQRFGSTGGDFGFSVAVDASENVFVTGTFQGTVNFGGGNLVSAGVGDIFVAKYNVGGTHQWSQRFGSASTDFGNSVAVDASGHAFVTGYFNETVDFGGGDRVSAGGADIFVAKYDAGGVHQWSQRFGSASTDFGNSVAVDASGNVFVTGFFNNTVDFGGGNLASAGVADIVVAKYDAGGTPQWSQRFGSTGDDRGYSVAMDASGDVLVTGYFSGTVNFGGGSLVSAGSSDIFVAKYGVSPAEPVISAITDIGNDQGRQVKIRFARSEYDQAVSFTPIVEYVAFRRDDPVPATQSTAKDQAGRELRADDWTEVGRVLAFEETSYGIDVPTIGDSTIALGQYHSVFYIRAATSAPGTFFDSPPDSGYSLDNLAPGVPESFAYATGQLSWDESSAADFDYFTVYGSNTDSFGASTAVDYSVAPAMDVTASPYVFYFVTATDFSGNEGKPAMVNTLSGVGGTPRSYVLSVSNYPNPFNPSTTVGYTVPRRGLVTVAIYDARGVLVTALVTGEERAPGAYTIEWDGRSDSGVTSASGIYFARIEQNGVSRSKKMLMLK
jgi:hypothetical protein